MRIMWSKYITRRLAVQVAQAWNFGWGKAMKKVYGLSVSNTLVFRDARKTEYYVDDQQHQKYVAGLYKLLNNQQFVKNFHREAKIKLETILKDFQARLGRDLSQLSNKQLLKIYQDFILPQVEQFYIRMWTVFNIGGPIADVILDNLKKYVTDEKKRTQYFLSLSSPEKPNDILRERIDILKLALVRNKLSRSDFLRRLSQHTKNYQHIPMFDFDHDPYKVDYFLREIKAIKNPQKELVELQESFQKRRKEFTKLVQILRPDKKFARLLYFLQEDVFLRDYRDMLRQKLNIELRFFYQEIGRRLGLNIRQVAVLTNKEIVKYLAAGKKFPRPEIHCREKKYLLIQKGSTAEIFSGAKAVKRFRKELWIEKMKRIKNIEGVIGSAGRAQGKVKIVYTNRDLNKVRHGDVIVATMTRQDFVTAIRKTVALVTDEGSITCHAAIIARELKIPCLVATKVATQVLQDGDLVEVDADKGVVLLIKAN